MNGTQVSHHLSSVLYTPLKLIMRLSDLSLPLKRTFPFEYLIHVNNRYAINRTIFLYE